MKKIPNTKNKFSPIIILVRPQLAENIGMVARAMMNCALNKLRIVNPKQSPLDPKAISASSGAQSILEEAEIYTTLEEATHDCVYTLATTARKRDMEKPILTPETAVQEIQNTATKNKNIAILFGAERTGLENHEVVSANAIIEIPLNPIHTSLNLSQAVLLVGYEWFKAQNNQPKSATKPTTKLASKEELNAFFLRLEDALEKNNYFRFKEKKEHMQHNLRNIFSRNNLTSAEIKSLHGVLANLTKKDKK